MIEHTLDKPNSILHVQVKSALEKGDFADLARTIDPYITETGGLAGMILEVSAFPGWENLGALVAHFRFVRDHHKLIRRIGVVTDSPIGKIAEPLASHFVSAEIKQFPAGALEAARLWVTKHN